MKFSREELESHRGGSIPDVLSDGVKLIFAGINPGLRSAATIASFANRGNRFFPALHLAGITDRVIDTSGGFEPRDIEYLARCGVGLTTLVNFATARASELTVDQLIAGRFALERTVERYRPRAVAVLGVTAYRTAFGEPAASIGRQVSTIAGSELWVVPSPSGLNAHYTLPELATVYARVASSAGLRLASESE